MWQKRTIASTSANDRVWVDCVEKLSTVMSGALLFLRALYGGNKGMPKRSNAE